MAMVWEPVAPWLRDINRLQTDDGGTFVPPADVVVTDEGVRVYMDVPGMRAEDLEIEFQNDMLTVGGERKSPFAESAGKLRRVERGYGRFQRSVRVPQGLRPEQIEASLTDGVLMLWIPKPEALKPRRIEVDTSAAGRSQPVGAGQTS